VKITTEQVVAEDDALALIELMRRSESGGILDFVPVTVSCSRYPTGGRRQIEEELYRPEIETFALLVDYSSHGR
jgi:hypothetical protein